MAINVTYQVYTGGRWLPNVTNLTDYAGIYGSPVQAVYAHLSSGSIQYRTHTQGGDWLPWVTDRTDYAGIYGQNIDGIQMKVIGLSGYQARYRAYVGGMWLPWVTGLEDYAGLYGQPIEAIQVEIVDSSSDGAGSGGINARYQVYTGGRWLPNVIDLNDYAGIYGSPVQAVYADLDRGSVQYRVHTINGSWLPWVTDRTDYAGILGTNIDGLQMQVNGLSNHNVNYRAYVGGRWLPWVTGTSDYAGLYGQAIEAIQVEITSGSSGGSGGSDGGDVVLPPVTGGRKVFIDPGHGGIDPGAGGNGINEKDVVLSISKMVGNILTRKGVTVEYSRKTDVNVTLAGRAEMANNWGASLFVSIHANSNAGTPATGTECYTYPSTDSANKQLSANVAKAISNKLGLVNRGHKEADFAVLRLTNMPAILVETAFINNASDANLLKNRKADFAEAIANEILKYLGVSTDEGFDRNSFYKYASNIGFFKGLGIQFTDTARYPLGIISIAPLITLAGEISTEAKLPHHGAANHINIGKGEDNLAQQLLDMLTETKIKIPFTKNELTLSLKGMSAMVEINDNISYSVKPLANGAEVTLEASFEYDSNITGYQRFILTIERSVRCNYQPVLLIALNTPEYEKLPEYDPVATLPEGTPYRFRMPTVDWGAVLENTVKVVAVGCILVILGYTFGPAIAALFL